MRKKSDPRKRPKKHQWEIFIDGVDEIVWADTGDEAIKSAIVHALAADTKGLKIVIRKLTRDEELPWG